MRNSRVLSILLFAFSFLFCFDASAAGPPTKAEMVKRMLAHRAKAMSALTGKRLNEAWVNPLDENRRRQLQNSLNKLGGTLKEFAEEVDPEEVPDRALAKMNAKLNEAFTEALGNPDYKAPMRQPESGLTGPDSFSPGTTGVLPSPQAPAAEDFPELTTNPVTSPTSRAAPPTYTNVAPIAAEPQKVGYAQAASDPSPGVVKNKSEREEEMIEQISADDMKQLAGALLAAKRTQAAHLPAPSAQNLFAPTTAATALPGESSLPPIRSESAPYNGRARRRPLLASAPPPEVSSPTPKSEATPSRRAFFHRMVSKLGPNAEAVLAAAENPKDNLGDLLMAFLPLLALSVVALLGLWRLRRQLERDVKGSR